MKRKKYMRQRQRDTDRTDEPEQKGKRRRSLNVEASVITYVFLALFLMLIAYFIYFMAFKSEDFINNPANPRVKGFEIGRASCRERV